MTLERTVEQVKFIDAIRWRAMACVYLGRWALAGCPQRDLPPIGLWQNAKMAWSSWRAVYMAKHYPERFIPWSQLLREVKASLDEHTTRDGRDAMESSS